MSEPTSDVKIAAEPSFTEPKLAPSAEVSGGGQCTHVGRQSVSGAGPGCLPPLSALSLLNVGLVFLFVCLFVRLCLAVCPSLSVSVPLPLSVYPSLSSPLSRFASLSVSMSRSSLSLSLSLCLAQGALCLVRMFPRLLPSRIPTTCKSFVI